MVNQIVTDVSEEKELPTPIDLISTTSRQASEKPNEKTEQTIEFEFGSDEESPKGSKLTSNSPSTSAFRTIEIKKCTICNKSTPGLEKLNKCGHFYHDHCLKDKVCHLLSTKKFKINCFKRD